MNYQRFAAACLAVFLILSSAEAQTQKAEVTLTLNEAFFDALLDSVFQNFDPPEFPIAKSAPNLPASTKSMAYGFVPVPNVRSKSDGSFCSETIKILPESDGVRTAVRFRDGKIVAPMAFSGNYNPPFVGCVDFAGWAETNIVLEFDQRSQRLIGRARVLNVSLNGTGGLGGSLIAKMVQSSIDKKINPIEIFNLDKVSFAFPVPKSGNLKMRATNIVPEIANGEVRIHINYEFLKG